MQLFDAYARCFKELAGLEKV